MQPAALYIHFPFCRHKCVYCDFYSIVDLEHRSRFVDALLREIDWQAGHTPFAEPEFSTLYIGGGTPSLLKPADLERIYAKLRQRFQFSDSLEFSLEANPGTIVDDRLVEYRRLGVNRLTLGVQSFVDAELKLLTRIHSAEKALVSIRKARQAGFDNIGIDLIFGLPNQTLETWRQSLEIACDLDVQHISMYGLTYEPGTPLTGMAASGAVSPLDDSLERDMYVLGKSMLEGAGFEHYEISNFARPGRRSQHNQAYWNGTPYLGLGPSAHSFYDSTRCWNTADLIAWAANLSANQSPVHETETITRSAAMIETVLLGMRRREGIDLEAWRQRFGFNLMEHLSTRLKSLEIASNGLPFAPGPASKYLTFYKNHLVLTLHGLLMYDTVCQQFASVLPV